MTRRAFTLIELLVVIAVVIILVALVAPFVGRSIKQAKGVRCVSNLRQIGAGLMGYVKDNGMRFQMSWSSMPAPPSERQDWTTVTLRYVPNHEIFKCPSRDAFPYTLYGNPQRGITFPLNYGISYGLQKTRYTSIDNPQAVGAVADADHDRFYANEGRWGMPLIRGSDTLGVKDQRVHSGHAAGLLYADWHADLVKDVTTDMFLPD